MRSRHREITQTPALDLLKRARIGGLFSVAYAGSEVCGALRRRSVTGACGAEPLAAAVPLQFNEDLDITECCRGVVETLVAQPSVKPLDDASVRRASPRATAFRTSCWCSHGHYSRDIHASHYPGYNVHGMPVTSITRRDVLTIREDSSRSEPSRRTVREPNAHAPHQA